ncbi:hypothetical protein INR49_006052 [Caranx melampygus]|nr:hypothetical protein INR49_006052 [Caranx melampygus]
MSWIPFKIGQPKKQIVSKTVERDFEREYDKLQKLEDQTKKLHKDMKKSTEADLAMSKAAVKISGDLLSNPLCEQDQAFLESMNALDTAMRRMDAFNQEKVNQIQKTVIDPLKNPLFLMCSGGGAMTGWNGSNFLFLVGGGRTCGQAQNMAKGPASWAQSRPDVNFIHSAGSLNDITVFISQACFETSALEFSDGWTIVGYVTVIVKRNGQPPRLRVSRPDLGLADGLDWPVCGLAAAHKHTLWSRCYFHSACSPHPDLSHGQWCALGPRAALNQRKTSFRRG